MPLDLGNLRDATNAMAQVVSVSEDPVFMNAQSGAVRNAIRAGVIQHFEFTYELCCNLMRRWLRENMNPDLVISASRRQMFRYAAQTGLIQSYEVWSEFAESRNLTSHTYREDVAAAVYASASAFFIEALALSRLLELSND